ncbi:MAG: SurA N-terminal domain-containing protein [Coriobacteriales bacterium]
MTPEAQPARGRRHAVVAVVATVVAVAAVIALAVVLLATGTVKAPGAAAKYNALSYVSEREVTDYIENYRANVARAESDEDWAAYLQQMGTDAAGLREDTIFQLVVDRRVSELARELGLTATDEEIDERVAQMQAAFGLDDENWEATLAMYGQTAEGYRAVCAQSVTQEKLCEHEVPMPECTDDELFVFLYGSYSDGISSKHVYYLTVDGLDEEGSFEKFNAVDAIRRSFASGPHTAEAFGELVGEYCTNPDVVATGGDMGWDINSSLLSEECVTQLERMDAGDVSQVFNEEGGYSFIWVAEDFQMEPLADADEPDQDKTLASLPEALRSYLEQQCNLGLWQQDCNEYLQQLYAQANVTIFDMPPNLSYAVE